MNMLELTKAELDSHDALTPSLNSHIQRIVNAVPYVTVDPKMKAVIAVSQLTAFASQFKRNIMLWDDTSVPINAIAFAITGSGGGKDSSVKAARKCFATGYKKIDTTRTTQVRKKAIEAAAAAGEELPEEFDVYKAYLKPIPPIDIMPTTGPGLIQHINDIADLDLSTGFIYSGEFSDELAYNPDMMENIKTLSEIYDTGDKEMKYTKGVEYRSKAIESQAISALFVGSPGHILYDEATKKKFYIAFMSKLARRSWFCYTPNRIPEPVFDTLDEMLDYEERLEIDAKQARSSMQTHIDNITDFGIKTANQHLTVPKDVFRLYKTYTRYNSDLANTMTNQASTSALIRRHLQWKAIKLSGAFAIFDQSDEIKLHHYIDAIRFCELLSKDMEFFEFGLNKSDHERFADYIRTEVQPNGKALISVHDIKKQNFISTTSRQKLQELVTLCSAYDTSGIYSLVNDNSAISYELIVKTEVLEVSFKPISISALEIARKSPDPEDLKEAKRDIAMQTAYGFTTGSTTFADLASLLEQNQAYSPFRFKDGVRSKDSVIGGTKWLVFDIDESNISASEAHFMLADINHHIALSSNPDNDFKFRALIELDSIVTLDPIAWRHFYAYVADALALQIDHVPQSQIFFSYAGRPILSVLDGEPLDARPFVIRAKERMAATVIDKPVSQAQQCLRLADPLGTFDYCFECPLNGPGSRMMIRMVYEAKNDLSATLPQILDLLQQVQDYWDVPLSETRFQAIIEQVKRMY